MGDLTLLINLLQFFFQADQFVFRKDLNLALTYLQFYLRKDLSNLVKRKKAKFIYAFEIAKYLNFLQISRLCLITSKLKEVSEFRAKKKGKMLFKTFYSRIKLYELKYSLKFFSNLFNFSFDFRKSLTDLKTLFEPFLLSFNLLNKLLDFDAFLFFLSKPKP